MRDLILEHKNVKWTSIYKVTVFSVILLQICTNSANANTLTERELISQSQKANRLIEEQKRQETNLASLENDLRFQNQQINSTKSRIDDLDASHDVEIRELESQYQALIDDRKQEHDREVAPLLKQRKTYRQAVVTDDAFIDPLKRVSDKIADAEKQLQSDISEIENELELEKSKRETKYQIDFDALSSNLRSLSATANELAIRINSEKNTQRRLKSEAEIEVEKQNKMYKALARQLAQADYTKYENALSGRKEVEVTHSKVCGDDVSPKRCRDMAVEEAKQKAVDQGADIIVNALSQIEISSVRNGDDIQNNSNFAQKSEIRSNGKLADWRDNITRKPAGQFGSEFIVNATAQVSSIANKNMFELYYQNQLDRLRPLLASTVAYTPVVTTPKPTPKPTPTPVQQPVQVAKPQPKVQQSFGNQKPVDNTEKDLEQEMAAERRKLAALRKQQEEARKKAEEDEGMGFGTIALIGLGAAAGAGAALAGGEEETDVSCDEDPSQTKCQTGEDNPNYDGEWTLTLSGSLNGVSSNEATCSSSAQVVYSNVDINHAINSTSFSIPLFSMSGTITNVTSGAVSINSGATQVTSSFGFQSTDEIQWSAFTGNFTSESNFNSNSFELVTMENGIPECTYNATISGTAQ
jgi:predicted adenine nucleotide alpha hydrolase (AANH) superfamily ATPase